ncbi:uncharacterized protein C7orf57-like isoform X2 [Oscarella lobularis]|uniref:uncharacterized protein C7orf57-like isoform X2 n=1 Tax=Oscarella lobularis TaxID=121494 RepID=UPI0033131B24
MTSGRGGSEDWFYHASKPKSDVPVDAPAPSQIPGLDGVGPDSDDERNDEFAPQYRVFDTDSKYVRLAKAGGRKNLLTYRDFVPKSKDPVPYPWPDWADTRNEIDDVEPPKHVTDVSKPDWAVHIEHKPSDVDIGERYSKAPFEWKSDPKQVQLPPMVRRRKEKEKKVSPVKAKVVSWSPVKKQASRTQLPKHAFKDPVSINRIMTMDYKREWFHARDRQDAERREEARAQVAHRKDLTQKHIMANLKGSRKEADESKERFTLTRFKNVPSKIGYIWSPGDNPDDHLEA